MENVKDMGTIKSAMALYKGQKVLIEASGSRKKTFSCVGRLEELYPSIFTVRADGPEGR